MGKNESALRRTLKAMREEGRLKDVPDALVAVAETLATAVDSGEVTPPLWREYRAALAALIEAGAGGDADDDTAEFLVSIRTPVRAPLGDAKKS